MNFISIIIEALNVQKTCVKMFLVQMDFVLLELVTAISAMSMLKTFVKKHAFRVHVRY